MLNEKNLNLGAKLPYLFFFFELEFEKIIVTFEIKTDFRDPRKESHVKLIQK